LGGVLSIESKGVALHLLARVPEGVGDLAAARRAAGLKVEVRAPSEGTLEPLKRCGLMLSCGAVGTADMREGPADWASP